MRQIIECAPWFNAGRDQETLEAITGVISESGVNVLGVQLDGDRAMVRFAGDCDAVERAVMASVATAAERIDLSALEGNGPHIGATDVIPLVPFVGASIDDCAALARRLGERMGRDLAIPVYLYGKAARPDPPASLTALEEGDLDALSSALESASLLPDFGPEQTGRAGATAVGAVAPHVRFFLILDREAPEAAQAVARALDGRSGGLAHVRARVVEAEGASSIETRVEHVDQTPLHRVLAVADNEAARFGAAVSRTSLEGLLPSSTLRDVAVWQLRLEGLEQEQTLEHVLLVSGDAAETKEVLPRSFVDAVASDSPTPGGGSVAALVGALSAALSSMVASLTLGREKYATVEDDVRELQGQARQVLASLLELASADSAAFEEVMTAYRMPRTTGEETEARRDAIDAALHKAIRVPLEIMASSLDAMRVAHRVAQLGNIKAVSDAGVAGYMGHAAVKSASLNVDVNVPGLRDLEEGDRYRREAGEMLAQASDLAGRIEVTVRERMKG